MIKVILLLLILVSTAAGQSLDQTHIDYFNPLVSGAECNNVTLQAAINAIGPDDRTLYLTATNRSKVACTWQINANITVPENIRLLVPFGVRANIASGVTFEILGCIQADDPGWYSGPGMISKGRLCGNDPGLWMGPAFISYVERGCQHPNVAGVIDNTIPECVAWIKSAQGPTLERLEMYDPVDVNYTPGNAAYYLIARLNRSRVPSGWTCEGGTPYCWQVVGSTLDVPDGTILLSKSQVTAGAITTQEPLHSNSPLNFMPVDATVYAQQYGMLCDGVTDNSGALELSYQALPLAGGVIVLPVADKSCKFSRTFNITKTITLRSAGSSRASPKTFRTVLEYTGSGVAIDIYGPSTQGTKLVGFEIGHSGTATHGVRLNNTSAVYFEDIVMFPLSPMTQFSQAGFLIGDETTTNSHTIIFFNCYIRTSAPIGIHAVKVNEYLLITHSKVLRHDVANINLGRTAVAGGSASANDIHILHSTLENPNLGSTSIRINRAEGVWIEDCHFEVGPPSSDGLTTNQALMINSQAERAAPITFQNNKVVAIAGATQTITVNFSSAFLRILGNYFLDGSGGTLQFHVMNLMSGGIVLAENREVTVSSRYNLFSMRNWSTAGGFTDGMFPYRICQEAGTWGTVGSTETTIYTCNVQGETMYTNGKGLKLSIGGSTLNNANSKRIRIYMGSPTVSETLIFDTGIVAANADSWYVECTGIRSTATGIWFTCHGKFHDVQPAVIVMTTGLTLSGWSGDRPITITGNGVVDNDVSMHFVSIHSLQ